jgi:hypothetical protein
MSSSLLFVSGSTCRHVIGTMATSTEHKSDLPHFVAHPGCDGGYGGPGDATRLCCDVMGRNTEKERQAVGAITQVIRVPWDSIVASRR